ncbi:S-adenosyl-L-methionine-dependent methyltransferase [Lasiosphaeris hirsuta]|uniref:S-adenosyl-L-methionine-dependent methyltransferase n=1 Tax=Lasiosphaeris hirsuta TaxID=260670 RepID=A0AA40A8H2_9PEZI|nr:S-adenosyl-L-methionine-dependent methyltransferase [Lasiosphaeris hirsuta]
MSLYHETAALLSAPATRGGSLKSRVFGSKDLKSLPAQVYALALESCKWSPVLKEVIDNARLLQTERKLTPVLALLLVHDFLITKRGIALPATHGLRAAVERHKARLTSELTRARLRRKCSTPEAFRSLVEAEAAFSASGGRPAHPRWVRVNTLKTTVDEQLETTFRGYEVVPTVQDVMAAPQGAAGNAEKILCLDGNIPNLIAVPLGTEVTKSEAYKSGALILQDKASCFPAYLLDPQPEDGDVADTCAAPGNKTTHLASIMVERCLNPTKAGDKKSRIHAFEKDKNRAKTLERMVKTAGSDRITTIHQGQDFLKVDPRAAAYQRVGALLLDPSCSGSGIVGRDDMPELHLPELPSSATNNHKKKDTKKDSKKRKRSETSEESKPLPVIVDDDGTTTTLSSEKDLKTRIEALATFQLALLLHAFAFPAARKITYSTCSIYAGENEHVVLRALASKIAKQRGWRILARGRQVGGMREWPVRGDIDACEGDSEVAEGCVRANRDDGKGVMGFFVAGFVRSGEEEGDVEDEGGPYVRDGEGRIVRDANGIPTFKDTGKKAAEVDEEGAGGYEGDDDGPYVRDAQGRISRDATGMPTLKAEGAVDSRSEDDNDDWGGFED